MENFDAIIVGGSFAGLSVASRMRGNILLIDKKKIGTNQTSACCTILSVIKNLGCQDSILQELDTIILHTDWGDLTFKLPIPFCTFDYQKLSQGMAKKIDAKIIKAQVLGREGKRVITDKGKFQSECIVDASGWKAHLIKDRDKDFVKKKCLSFAIETTLDYKAENLHFWITPELVRKGVGWLFPCGESSRFGVGSYEGVTDLNKKLDLFLSKFELNIDSVHPVRSNPPPSGSDASSGKERRTGTSNGVHGGFFPHQLREPVIDGIFLVGDSAGQCMALSGEGIREAIHFGQVCGGLIHKVIERKLPLEQAQRMYRDHVLKYRKAFNIMLKFQSILINLPNFWLTQVLRLLSKDIIFRPVMLKYETIM
ncbi:MAG TPA: hypothetical protein ENH97_00550 [bacterium]|nr:hypothetical protein [bacterium]